MLYSMNINNMFKCDLCDQEKEISKNRLMFCDNCKKRICDKCYRNGFHGQECRFKKCRKCNNYKQVNEFCKHSISNDGYYNYCKECIKIINRERYIKRKTIYIKNLEPIDKDDYDDEIKYDEDEL